MSSRSAAFDRHTIAQEVADEFPDEIKGKYVIVTGVSPGGIGQETARAIATKEPKLLVIAGRDSAKLEASLKTIKDLVPNVNMQIVIIDLASLQSVREAAKKMLELGSPNILINNAALMRCPYGVTEDGFETQFGVNYVGPFLLTKLLLPTMLKTSHPRVVNLSSYVQSDIRWDDIGFSQGKAYDPVEAYGQSKTAKILTTVELAERYGKDGLVALSLHPGGISTPLQRHFKDEDYDPYRKMGIYKDDNTPNWDSGIWKTIEEGAATTLVAAFDPEKAKINGSYLYDCHLRDTSEVELEKAKPYAKDKTAAKRLWAMTEDLINRGGPKGIAAGST